MTLRDKMLAVIADVNASVAEREELVEMIAIALLTRKNLFVLGDPGQAQDHATAGQHGHQHLEDPSIILFTGIRSLAKPHPRILLLGQGIRLP